MKIQRRNIGLDINIFNRFKAVCKKNYRGHANQIEKWLVDEEKRLGIKKETKNEPTQ
tara:strand:- start:323 stop:493 length:171 start_codon:yes stop_codon:yes gene_type:complete